MQIVSYLRVSTARQGHSGLGLEAQRAAIATFAQQKGATINREFVEIESGTEDGRPELERALHLAKITGATLAVAKLDRLTRDAGFFAILKKSGARFIVVDMPDAEDFIVGIMSYVAQKERDMISARTKAALAAVKARGVRLGNPNGAAALRRAGKGNVASLGVIRAKADSHAEALRPVLSALAGQGVTSLGEIAAHLTADGILTPRGNAHWHKASVRNLLGRLHAGAR